MKHGKSVCCEGTNIIVGCVCIIGRLIIVMLGYTNLYEKRLANENAEVNEKLPEKEEFIYLFIYYLFIYLSFTYLLIINSSFHMAARSVR